MPQKARVVKKILQEKGFKEERRDHWYYIFIYNEKLSHISTKISHGEVDISDPDCSRMAKQIKLSNPQFRNFVDCRLTKEDYLAVLIQSGNIVPQPPLKPK